MEEESPIKENLFEYIKKSEKKIQELLSQKKMSVIIEDIISSCYDKVTQKNKDENLAVLATGILHYMLTNAMITSQRKIEFQGISLDIVIPDLKTLEKDPKKSIIIHIPETSNKILIKEKIELLECIQPEKQNIWLVLNEDLGFKNKTFEIKKGGSFTNIIFEIVNFVNVQGNDKFKILKI